MSILPFPFRVNFINKSEPYLTEYIIHMQCYRRIIIYIEEKGINTRMTTVSKKKVNNACFNVYVMNGKEENEKSPVMKTDAFGGNEKNR